MKEDTLDRWARLPTELWQYVIEEIILNDVALTQNATRRSLCALAQTCRYLNQVVTPILFDTVYFETTAAFNRYVKVLRTRERPPPVTFTLNVAVADSYASEENPKQSFNQFIDLVLENPRLRIMNVRGVEVPLDMIKLRDIALNQMVQVTQASPSNYGFRPRDGGAWWSSSLRRLCLGPEHFFDAQLWGLLFSHETIEQIIIQFTSMRTFTQMHIIQSGPDDCYEAVRRARDARRNRNMAQLILIQRLHEPRHESDIDHRSIKVLRAAAASLVPYFCLGLEIYNLDKKPVMSLANRQTWEVLSDEAVQLHFP